MFRLSFIGGGLAIALVVVSLAPPASADSGWVYWSRSISTRQAVGAQPSLPTLTWVVSGGAYPTFRACEDAVQEELKAASEFCTGIEDICKTAGLRVASIPPSSVRFTFASPGTTDEMSYHCLPGNIDPRDTPNG